MSLITARFIRPPLKYVHMTTASTASTMINPLKVLQGPFYLQKNSYSKELKI